MKCDKQRQTGNVDGRANAHALCSQTTGRGTCSQQTLSLSSESSEGDCCECKPQLNVLASLEDNDVNGTEQRDRKQQQNLLKSKREDVRTLRVVLPRAVRCRHCPGRDVQGQGLGLHCCGPMRHGTRPCSCRPKGVAPTGRARLATGLRAALTMTFRCAAHELAKMCYTVTIGVAMCPSESVSSRLIPSPQCSLRYLLAIGPGFGQSATVTAARSHRHVAALGVRLLTDHRAKSCQV
jgi:hypothetical protein